MDSAGWIYTAGHTDWDWTWVQQWSPDLHSFGTGSGGYWKCMPQALVVEDVSPPPYNHPPYPPSGVTASDSCTVTGLAP